MSDTELATIKVAHYINSKFKTRSLRVNLSYLCEDAGLTIGDLLGARFEDNKLTLEYVSPPDKDAFKDAFGTVHIIRGKNKSPGVNISGHQLPQNFQLGLDGVNRSLGDLPYTIEGSKLIIDFTEILKKSVNKGFNLVGSLRTIISTPLKVKGFKN